MILGFKKEINGCPTHFVEKILEHLNNPRSYIFDSKSFLEHLNNPKSYSFEPKSLTLRDDPNDRWQSGKTIHFATGVRTKAYNCFAMGKCRDTAYVWFQWKGGLGDGYQLNDPDRPGKYTYYVFSSGGKSLSHLEAIQLAKKDGFDSLQEFFDFHYSTRKDKNDLSWAKKIIYF